MKKLAIFVEGQTEQIFIRRLISEIAGEKNVNIDEEKHISGQKFITINAHKANIDAKYYILIRNCGGDSKVKSCILEALVGMSNKDYERILGVLDVYPKLYKDIPLYIYGLNYRIPTRYIPIKFILAIMEIESWFIAEYTHFPKIHPKLTIEKIKRTLNFDPSTECSETRPHPAWDLDVIYRQVDLAYKKHKSNCERTIKALDFARIYLKTCIDTPSLGNMISELNAFFS